MIAVPVIAIYDIGKTNKKLFLIDEYYRIVFENTVQFQEITDEDGDSCDDLKRITEWVCKTLIGVLQKKRFEVKAVNFSTYGASLVYINEKGKCIAPLYSYLKNYPEKIKNELYDRYGGADKISCETASPVLGSLNSGMQLYRIKIEKPLLYDQVKYALHLPQYFSYLISKKVFSDITSIGCHTQLWDYQKNHYHQWVLAEGLEQKLAPLQPSFATSKTGYHGKVFETGTGLHDSSAALIPYLAFFKEPFVLISTGTWCISLNSFNHEALTAEELKHDCLFYLEYKGRPVKASRLFAGHEHEQQIKKLAKQFNKPVGFYKKVKFNPAIIVLLKKKYRFETFDEADTIKLPGPVFKTRDLTDFKNYEEAYHCLVLDIIQQQFISTRLVISGSTVNRIFVDGGFSENSIYMHLLALAFTGLEVYAASVAQATAMGAALAIHQKWNMLSVPADMVKLKYYKVSDIEHQANEG